MPYLIVAVADNNDQVAFASLYRHFYPGLLSFAESIIKDRQLSEETVENVFIKLWENRKMLSTVKNLSHYLYVSVKHAALNCIYRQKKIKYETIGDEYDVSFSVQETHTISKENVEKIATAINNLPPKCKLIFRLIKEEGLKYADVAHLLDISLKTVESQMYIAVNKIAQTLEVSLPEYRQFYPSKKNKNN